MTRKRIFADRELAEEAVIKQYLTTAADGKTYNVKHYNLQAIITVGFKIENERAVQFRKWATQVVKDYTIQGWVMDVDRLKSGGSVLTQEFFDRQLEKVREIRLSERKFYQMITDIYATSVDYDATAAATQRFFVAVQNKLHFAVHGQTAAEVIVERADAEQPHMGLTTWEGALQGKIHRYDVVIAKNYLSETEMDQMQRIVSAYLDMAEMQAMRRIQMTMADWEEPLQEPTMPPHFALNFERGAELSAALRKEIAEHHWEVASVDAYPWLVAVDEDLVARPPTAEEVTIAEAIALALPKVLKQKKTLLAAWNGGETVARTLVVATHAGDVEVSLRVPYERKSREYKPPYDLLADLFELGQDGDEIDAEARGPIEDELVRRFVASPEAKALTDVQSCHFVMDFAADYFNATIATLGPRELREIVFDIIPRKVSIDASAASWIIEENRAFYAFLKREFALEQADACLRVLGGDAVKKLEAALSDTSKFGMAKSLFMGGREAGFDMESKEGIEAWMRVMQSQPLPASVRLPSLGTPARPQDKAVVRAKKNVLQATCKERKKN